MSEYFYHDQLESERLRSRFFTEKDVAPWSAFFEDIKAIEFLQPFIKSTTLESATAWFERMQQRTQEKRYGLQVITDKHSGEFLGICGLLLQEINGKTELEVGYHFFKKNWGNGYAPEAARMFITYAFTHNLAPSVISIIDIRNRNSQRVAEKNGLIQEPQTRWKDMDVFIYRVLKEDWK